MGPIAQGGPLPAPAGGSPPEQEIRVDLLGLPDLGTWQRMGALYDQFSPVMLSHSLQVLVVSADGPPAFGPSSADGQPEAAEATSTMLPMTKIVP